jgi:flagella synthesis protein FlgN
LPSIESLLLVSSSTLTAFLAAIEAERQCLNDSDSGALPDITNRKAALAAQLASIDTRRDTALAAAGFSPGRAGIEAWLASLPGASGKTFRATWQSILELAARAKSENEINGNLIATRLQFNQQALGVLLGDTADSNTYGADGQRSTKAGRRNLGSA